MDNYEIMNTKTTKQWEQSINSCEFVVSIIYDDRFPIDEVKTRLIQALERNEEFCRSLKVDLRPFSIELIYSRLEFSQRLGRETEAWESGYCDNNKFIIFHPNFFEIETSHSREDFAKTLTHEINHLYINQINPKKLWWVSEGVAQHIARQCPKVEIKTENIEHFLANSLSQNKNYRDYIAHQGYAIPREIIKSASQIYGEEILIELIKVKADKNAAKKLAKILYTDSKRLNQRITGLITGNIIIKNYA